MFYEIRTQKLKEIKIRVFRRKEKKGKKKKTKRKDALFKVKISIRLVPKSGKHGSLDVKLNSKRNN